MRYLNTAKSVQFVFQEIPPFTQQLATVATDMESLSQNKMSAEIIAVQIASKTLSCVSCTKKSTLKSEGKIANCLSCKIMMKVSSCEAQWFLKLIFQKNIKVTEKISLTLFHPEVIKLRACVPDVNLEIISEKDLQLSLLDVGSNFYIKYDTASNKLLDVSLEAI